MRRYIRHLPDKPTGPKIKLKDLDRQTKALIINQIKLEKSTLFYAFLAMIVVTVCSLALPYLSKIAIDKYISSANKKGLFFVALTLIAIALITWTGSYLRGYFTSKAANRSVSRIREELYQHVLNQSISFFEQEKTGDIITRLSGDVGALSDLVASGLLSLIGDLFTLVGVIYIMLKLSPRLAGWLLTTVPIMIILLRQFGYKIKTVYATAREKSAELTSGVEEDISGIKVVQSLNRQDKNAAIFSDKSKEAVKANIKAVSSMATLSPLMAIIQVGGLILILWVGGTEVAKGRATIGTLLAFLSYSRQLFQPLSDLTNLYTVLQSSLASLERITDYLSRKPAVPQPTNAKQLKDCRGQIEITNITFGYNEKPLFTDFSLSIKPGETLALVGPTGSGKSTLISLISRLYDPQKGSISIDSVDLRDLDNRNLRKHIAVVPQTVTLFAGTLKDNIAYGRPNANMEAIETAAKRAAIHDFILTLPLGYNTEIGEAGKGLSGGQKQLISYARAILANPSILILDEATSSVDAKTETAIKNAMEDILKNRTCIIIAHRFATLKYADRIAVLNKGMLEAIGSRDELMKSSSLYQELVSKQMLA